LRLLVIFHNKLIFYGEKLIAQRPTPKLEEHALSAVHDCIFNIFAATLHNWRTHHAMVTRDPPNMELGTDMGDKYFEQRINMKFLFRFGKNQPK
jgi:hypothetical protein